MRQIDNMTPGELETLNLKGMTNKAQPTKRNSYERFLISQRVFCEARPFCTNKAAHVRKLDGRDRVLCDEHNKLASQSDVRQGDTTLISEEPGSLFSNKANTAFEHAPIKQGDEEENA